MALLVSAMGFVVLGFSYCMPGLTSRFQGGAGSALVIQKL
jgi:hypothetical protein